MMINRFKTKDSLILQIDFTRNPEELEHSRNIYGPLDLLGDIGGLSDAMLAIGSALIALIQAITGNPLLTYLATNLFELDKSPRGQHLSTEDQL